MTVPSLTGQDQHPYLRLATIDDLGEIVDCGLRALIHDPLMSYWGNVKKVCRKLKNACLTSVKSITLR